MMLSAALLHTALRWPACALGGFVAGLLLWYTAFSYKTLQQACLYGLWWGLCFYGSHLDWLLSLLLNKSSYASRPISYAFYGCMVFYFSLFASLWWGLSFLLRVNKKFFLRLLSSLAGVVGYFVFLEYWGLLLFNGGGYPFANPLIPLSRFPWFLSLVASLSNCLYGPTYQHDSGWPETIELVYIAPKKTKDIQQRLYAVYQIIGRHKSEQLGRQLLFIAPESTIPFHINQESWMLTMLQSGLPPNAHLLLGAQFENEHQNLFQAVYCQNLRRIKNIYKKKHSVPFSEKMPPFLKKWSILKNIFLKDLRETIEDNSTEEDDIVFEINDDFIIIPRMCSELFFMCCAKDFIKYRMMKKKVVLFFFVNDSWFVDYFTKIMENVTCIKAAWFGLPIVYIGHERYQKIKL